MISFIIPAHNEEALIGQTLSTLHASAAAVVGSQFEIIVVSDSCTDRTAAIAGAKGARVIEVDHRQIARTRNSGAQAACGNIFIFVDADTLVPVLVLRAALSALRAGAVGGGCCINIDGRLPFYARVLERVLQAFSPAVGLAGGCFIFCTKQAYFRAGGFDQSLFCAEEVAFSQQLKRQGRFVILRQRVTTSGGENFAFIVAWGLLRIGVRIARSGKQAMQQRKGLEYWYGPRVAESFTNAIIR